MQCFTSPREFHTLPRWETGGREQELAVKEKAWHSQAQEDAGVGRALPCTAHRSLKGCQSTRWQLEQELGTANGSTGPKS